MPVSRTRRVVRSRKTWPPNSTASIQAVYAEVPYASARRRSTPPSGSTWHPIVVRRQRVFQPDCRAVVASYEPDRLAGYEAAFTALDAAVEAEAAGDVQGAKALREPGAGGDAPGDPAR